MINITGKLFNLKKRTEQYLFGGCAVLLYHRVADLVSDPQLLAVSPENFKGQLEFLQSDYRILNSEEFEFYIVRKKRFPEKSVFLTFDDGYEDNYRNAMPILEKYNAQALFYIATGTINTSEEFWWDEVERILLNKNSVFPETIKFSLSKKELSFTTKTIDDRIRTYQALLPILRNLNFESRRLIIDHLNSVFGISMPRDGYMAMSNHELLLFSKSSSVVIGGHSVNHPSLAALEPEEQSKEILSSKIFLEELLGKKIFHFSYPFGTKYDFNKVTSDIVRKAGFKMAAANFPSLTNRSSDLFGFPRFLVRDWNIQMFSSQLKSFFS